MRNCNDKPDADAYQSLECTSHIYPRSLPPSIFYKGENEMRCFLINALVVFMLLLLQPNVSSSALLGDFNNDGIVSIAEVQTCINSFLGIIPNTAPAANAGSAQSVTTGAVVTLDGSGSSDANGDPLTYSWAFTKPSGSNATLSSATVVKPIFTPDAAGAYVFNLVVNDGKVDSATATVTITASAAKTFNVTATGY